MAQDTKKSVTLGTWTQLTNADTSGDVSVALLSDHMVWLQATTNTTPPTTEDGLPLMRYGDGWSEATIAEKFPGVSGALRLWAFCPNANVQLYISHG